MFTDLTDFFVILPPETITSRNKKTKLSNHKPLTCRFKVQLIKNNRLQNNVLFCLKTPPDSKNFRIFAAEYVQQPE